MINWGIIGLGNIADRFAKSLQNSKSSRLFAISSRNQNKADEFAKKFSASKAYSSYDLLLADKDVQAIYIALPHSMHKDFSIRAMKSGKAVLCEKPATLNPREMEEIVQISREEKISFMEAMKPRFQPIYRKLKSMVAENIIGEIFRVDASLCNEMNLTGKTYHTQKGQGGALLDVGIYCASWLDDFLGKASSVKKIISDVHDGIDFYIDAELDFSGKIGRIECAFDRKKPRQAILHGTLGKIIVDELHRPQSITILKPNEDQSTIQIPYEVDDFFSEIKHFEECLENRKIESDLMSLDSSLNCAQILELIRKNF